MTELEDSLYHINMALNILENKNSNNMKKAVVLKPNVIPKSMTVISAKLVTNDGIEKIIVAAKEGINKVILSFTNEGGLFDTLIESVHDAGTPLFIQVEEIFNDLFNRLPRFIEQDGIRYELGRFAAPGKELDRVVYQVLDIEQVDKKLILVEVTSPAMIRANSLMHNKLEELGYL
jgi:hypothetical protein